MDDVASYDCVCYVVKMANDLVGRARKAFYWLEIEDQVKSIGMNYLLVERHCNTDKD